MKVLGIRGLDFPIYMRTEDITKWVVVRTDRYAVFEVLGLHESQTIEQILEKEYAETVFPER